MKKFTLFAIAALLSVVSFAQNLQGLSHAATSQKGNKLAKVNVLQRSFATNANATRRAASDFVIITEQPAGELKTFSRSGSYLYVSNSSLNIGTQEGNVDIVFGEGNAIYIKDPLMDQAYGSWVSGTYENGKVTIPVPQNLYYVATYDACIALIPINSYSTPDETATEITYTVTQSDGKMVLTLDGFTSYNRTLGAYWTDDHTLQVYGEYNTVFTEGAAAVPEVVEAPAGLEVDEYSVSARNYNDDADVSGSVFIGFDGSDVYVKGLSTALPDAWVKGTLAGTTVSFAAEQYFGVYNSNKLFLNKILGEDVVFEYDATANTFTAQNEFFLVDNGASSYWDSYRNAVIKKVIEKPATPANPEITDLEDTNYGKVVVFNIPTVDTEGNGLVSSKLSYQFFTDIEKEVAPLTFTPETHIYLDENLTVIPYGFTEAYDFYSTYIFLNDLYSADWNKIGIKSIYEGGGETHETEIQWFTIKAYAIEVAIEALTAEIATAEALLNEGYTNGLAEFNAAIDAAKAVLNNADATAAEVNAAVAALKAAEEALKAANGASAAQWVASQQGYANAELVESFTIDENISAAVAQNDGGTAPAYYNTGNALRLYGGNTLTIAGGENVVSIDQIVLTTATGNNSGSTITADAGTYTFSGTKGTWEADAENPVAAVTFTRPGSSGHARIQTIDVYYTIAVNPDEPGGTFDYEKIAITPAEGQVESLESFVISFGGQEVTVNEDALPNLTKTGTDDVVAEAGIALNDDGTVSVDLSDRVSADGNYTLNIPENAIFFNGTSLDPLSFKYTIGTPADYAIDPAEGEVESLSAFTITFDYFVEVVDDAVAYLINTETDAEVQGAVYALGSGKGAYVSLNEEVTAPGTYQLVIPDGQLQKTSDDSFLPELAFNYTIVNGEEPVEPVDFYEAITIDPAEGQVESLQSFTITFPAAVGEIAEGAVATLTNTTTGTTYTLELTDAGNTVIVYGLSEPIIEAGQYTLDIPQGAVVFYNQGADFVLNPLQFKYQVGTLADYTIDPAEGPVTSLSTFTITFNNYIVEETDEAAAILFNTETEAEVEGYVYAINGGKAAYISLAQEVTTPGTYQLIILDGSLKKTIDDSFLPELAFDYTISSTDGIMNITLNSVSEAYSLNGQKVMKPVKGIFIVNGKKVVIK